MPCNCAPRIRIWGSNCQHNFLRGGFEASERSCASRATGIVGGEAMHSPHDNAPTHSALIVFGAQFHHRARTSPLLARFSLLRFFSCSPNANWCCGGGIWGMWRRFKVNWHRCWRASEKRNSKGAFSNGNGCGTSVLCLMGSVLKGATLMCPKICKIKFV